jgi:hypothetical protein
VKQPGPDEMFWRRQGYRIFRLLGVLDFDFRQAFPHCGSIRRVRSNFQVGPKLNGYAIQVMVGSVYLRQQKVRLWDAMAVIGLDGLQRISLCCRQVT